MQTKNAQAKQRATKKAKKEQTKGATKEAQAKRRATKKEKKHTLKALFNVVKPKGQ